MPKISVIMNCYNGERYVEQAIRSVYAQTFTDWEIVFWDNASKDGTPEIARKFDHKLRYFRSAETTPLGQARLAAMAEARGDWIGFLDHDDLYFPALFERLLASTGAGDFSLCYAGVREIDEQGRVTRDFMPQLKSGYIFPDLLRYYEIGITSTIVSTAYLKRFGILMDPTFIMAEEYNLFMRIAAKGPVCVVPEALSNYRLVSGSGTDRHFDRQARERFDTLEQIRRENPGIEQRYPDAFRGAEAHGYYFLAQSQMQSGAVREARCNLRKIRKVRPVFFFLLLVSFWPGLWRLIHRRDLKARLVQMFSGFSS